MPFKPEDGTGLPDANSFASVEEANVYFEDRGAPMWAPVERREALLVIASTWIDSLYYDKFKGVPLTPGQSLSYPRDIEGVPLPLKYATFELARVALNTPLYNTSVGTDRQVIEKKTGPLTTKYAVPTLEQLTANREFPFVELMLRSLIEGGGGFNVRLRRV